MIVTVTNLGPSAVWLDPNTCPGKFEVGVEESLPSVRTEANEQGYVFDDYCFAVELSPELWKVGETKVGLLARTHLPPGTYAVTAWAEPKVAPDIHGKPAAQFQTVRVEAPTVVLTVP